MKKHKILITLILSCLFLFATVHKKHNFVFKDKSQFITLLKVEDKGYKKSYAGNVIQGLAYYDKYWITTQAVKNKFLVINFLDKNGISIYNNRITYPSHGQDLSVIYLDKENVLKLYTASEHWQGLISFDYKINKQNINYLKKNSEINLSCKFCTPALNIEGTYILKQDLKHITIYNKQLTKISAFKIAKKQLPKRQWLQGLIMKDNLIYCLTGANKLKDKKYIYVYNMKGKVLYNKELNFGKNLARKEGKLHEFEGLTLKGNELYTTLMTGKNKKYIKRLYKILEIN